MPDHMIPIRRAAVALLVALPLTAASPGPPGAAASEGARALPMLERSVLSEINALRARHGVPRLARSALLAMPARAHSRRLVRTGMLTHGGPGGVPFWRRYVVAGFPRRHRMAENIATVPSCGKRIERQVVSLWMASPPHRANMLDRRLRVVGIGMAQAVECRIGIVTAAFGS